MEEKEEKRGSDHYVPAVVAITLRSTSKRGGVIQTQIIRAPTKGEPPGFFAEVDKALKDHASNNIVELGNVIPVTGLYLHLVSAPRQTPLSAEQSAALEKVTAPALEPGKE